MSKSKSATPPLIDSRMYFFSGDETWEKVMPLALVTSVNVTVSAARAGAIAICYTPHNAAATISAPSPTNPSPDRRVALISAA